MGLTFLNDKQLELKSCKLIVILQDILKLHSDVRLKCPPRMGISKDTNGILNCSRLLQYFSFEFSLHQCKNFIGFSYHSLFPVQSSRGIVKRFMHLLVGMSL